jgi:hypothetical protein
MGKTIFTCVYIEKKIFFSRTSGPISIKLGTTHPGHLQRGDNHKNAKMDWGHLKIFFPRTTEPEELIFT